MNYKEILNVRLDLHSYCVFDVRINDLNMKRLDTTDVDVFTCSKVLEMQTSSSSGNGIQALILDIDGEERDVTFTKTTYLVNDIHLVDIIISELFS